MKLSSKALLRAYRQMKTIRLFEERLSQEIAKGEIPGFTHLYAGQEACAVGVCEVLALDDLIVSTHRGHGHCIAKGCDVKGMMAEIFGRATGLCGGKSGSMHIADLDMGMLGANGIVGGGQPIAVGAAIATRNQGNKRVTASFGGDGSVNQGTVFESMNMAVVLKLPTLFIIENNQYSEHTHVSYAVGSGDIAARSAAFGMPAEKVDGEDFFEVYAATKTAVDRARSGKGPTTLELVTQRFYGHVEGDPQNYRGDGELKRLRAEHDCIEKFKVRVIEDKMLSALQLDKEDKKVAQLIEEAVEEARRAPLPPEETLLTDVYHAY